MGDVREVGGLMAVISPRTGTEIFEGPEQMVEVSICGQNPVFGDSHPTIGLGSPFLIPRWREQSVVWTIPHHWSCHLENPATHSYKELKPWAMYLFLGTHFA